MVEGSDKGRLRDAISPRVDASPQASGAFLKVLVEATAGPAFAKDGNGAYVLSNAALADALGFGAGVDPIGYRDADLLPGGLAAELGAADAAANDSDSAISTEQEIGGRIFRWRRVAWRDTDGRQIGLVGTAEELTQQRRSTHLLRKSEELLALAQEAGRVGLFEWEVPSGIVRVSAQLLALYGLSEFDGQYVTWLGCIFREDRVRISSLIEAAISEGTVGLNFEFRVSQIDDRAVKWIEARNIIFYDGVGRALRMVGVNVDITEKKRAIVQMRAFTDTLEDRVRERTRELETEFAARQRAEESLRQTQKIDAVGQLTGGIAHDFNNLLTIVLGGLDAIGRQLPKLPEAAAVARIQKSRDIAVQGVWRAAALVERLMAFSRQQPLMPTVIDANGLVAGLCELLRRTLGEPVALETVLAGDVWPCFVDANQLENAILNLAVNARDAMPRGGKLTIETANCRLDDARVSKFNEQIPSGQYVLLTVSDTGTGMSPATLSRAYEPFFTTKEVGKGTGLGLSQVYGFVRQSSGHIQIYSEIGEGTTVRLYLPRHLGGTTPTRRAPQAAATPGIPRAIGVECVLLVEDNEALRTHAIEILRELGYRVLEASCGSEALEILDRDLKVDLLFTDIVMPGGMNGRQLADEAARRRPGLKVLFTTGYTRNEIVHNGRLDAGIHLITKPYSFPELAFKIRERMDA